MQLCKLVLLPALMICTTVNRAAADSRCDAVIDEVIHLSEMTHQIAQIPLVLEMELSHQQTPMSAKYKEKFRGAMLQAFDPILMMKDAKATLINNCDE